MSKRLTLFPGLAAAMVFCALAPGASALVWSEIGDAGDLVSTAQTTAGLGGLTSITGTLSSPTDVDMYCILSGPTPRIPGLTVVSLQCSVNQGPNVWVFDANGVGISTNETCLGGGKTLTNNTVPTAGQGTFYVAVSYYGLNPSSGSGSIWLPAIGGERAPDGPGAAGALTGWPGTPVVQPPSTYQINLGYTAPCSFLTPVAPSTWDRVKTLYRD